MYGKYTEFLTSFPKIQLIQIKLLPWEMHRYLGKAERRGDSIMFLFINIKFGCLRIAVWCRSQLAMEAVVEMVWGFVYWF